jgi:plastocyanin
MKKFLHSMVFLAMLFVVPFIHNSYADDSPVEAVIMIKQDQNGTVYYQPQTVTIKPGGEILIANVATSDHSVTSGSGPDDPLSGKSFDTGIIKSKGFTEYASHNLIPGNYSFYSSADPQVRGQLVVLP